MPILSITSALAWGILLFCYAKLLRFAIPLCVQERLLSALTEQKEPPHSQTTNTSHLPPAKQAVAYSALATCYLLIPIGGLPAFFSGVTTLFVFYIAFPCQTACLIPQPYGKAMYALHTTILTILTHGSLVLFSERSGIPGSLWQLDVFSLIHPWQVASFNGKIGILLMACAFFLQLPQPQLITQATRLSSIASLLFLHCLFITLFLPFNLYHLLGKVTPWIAAGDLLLFFIKCDTLLLCRAIIPNISQSYIYGLVLLGSTVLLLF